MTDRHEKTDGESVDALAAMAVTSSYKVLGQLSDADGVGVLGQNDATTGTPVGVKGAVPGNADGYGLETPDDARIEGAVDTSGTDFVVRAGTESTNDARNVVHGHVDNDVFDGVVGATIGGGGYDDGTDKEVNRVSDNYGTIAGGRDNLVGNNTGGETDVRYGTVGGGKNNNVTGAGGTVPGGIDNAAIGETSFAAGRQAKARFKGSFVWADSTASDVEPSGNDQFIVEADGGVGLGTDSPATQLHVLDSISDKATTTNHVVAIENTSSDGSADVLALRIGEDASNIGSGNNFVTFKDNTDNSLGAIQGDGKGGVTTASGGADYAEWLPRAVPDESVEPGDVVGVRDGEISRRAGDADRAMVVTSQPVVAGNDPGPEPAARRDHEQVAFVGQAPVKVRGPVEEGDLVVPSGEDDGTGRAVSPAAYRPGDDPIVGRAWESDDAQAVTQVTVAVDLEVGEVLGPTLASQQETVGELRARNEALREDVTDLEADLERKDRRIETLEDRLTAVEETVTGQSSDADGSVAHADD